MTITIWGAIWLTLLLYLFYIKDIEGIITALFFSMVFQCNNVVVMGEKGVGPQLVTSVYFIIIHFFLPYKPVLKKRYSSRVFLFFLFLFCIYVLINSIVRNTYSDHFLDVAVLFVYLFTAICLYSMRDSLSIRQKWNIINRLYIFLLAIGILQLFATSKVVPKWILADLFYNDISENVYFHINSSYFRIMSTFMEPSYFSGLLCGLIGVYVYRKDKIRNATIYILIGLIELLLTFSTTGYLTFLLVMFSLAIIDRSKKNNIKYISFFAVIAIIVTLAWDTLISDVVINKIETGSGQTRQGWNIVALEEFMSNPLMGAGYITRRASSLILSILANLGVIGLFLYLSAAVSCLYSIFHEGYKRKELIMAGRLVFLSVVISQFIACPDLSLCTFWLSVYMVVFSDIIHIPNMHVIAKALLVIDKNKIKDIFPLLIKKNNI